MSQTSEDSIVVAWSAGSFRVYEPFYSRWNQTMDSLRPLPLGEEIASADRSIRTQEFLVDREGAVGTLSLSRGQAWWVVGRIRDKWYELAALDGVLGAPCEDAVTTWDGRGFLQRFSSIVSGGSTGAIVDHPLSGGPFALDGAIYHRWAADGFEAGAGLPQSNVLSCGDGRGLYAHFNRGPCRIYWLAQFGAALIRPPFYELWSQTGYERGPLGYPIRESVLDKSRQRPTMDFEHGRMWVSEQGETCMSRARRR